MTDTRKSVLCRERLVAKKH